MTIQDVPTDANGLPSYVQTTTFEGTQYILELDYNQRCASWYLSIADANNVDIYNGIKLVTGFPLLRKCVDPRRPPGELFVFSSTSDLSPPALLDLIPGSGRCSLVYITSDWVALIAAGQVGTVLAQLAANTQTSATSAYGQQG
jgi:hypothetical protein